MSSNAVLARATEVARLAGAAGVVSDAVLAEDVAALRRLADVAEAAYAVKLREFDARGVGEAVEVLTTKQWVRHHLNVAAGSTGQTLRVARQLAKLPVVEAALAAGVIRWPHAAAIADLAALLGTEVIAGCQAALVDAASVNDPARFRAALRAMGMAVDSETARKRARKDQDGRWLDVAATFDGAVAIEGMLDAETGAIVAAAIDAAAKPAGAGDLRSAAQRRADALVDICRGLTGPVQDAGNGCAEARAEQAGNNAAADINNADVNNGYVDDEDADVADDAPADGAGEGADATATAAAPGPGVGSGTVTGSVSGAASGRGAGCRCGGRGARASLIVVCDLDTLLDLTGGFGELPTGHAVPGDTVRRLACDASITRVVVDAASQPLDVGRSQRTVTAAQLKALRVRDGGCRFPGCDRPFEWTDAHHVIWWANNGTTDITNLILLCRKHHTAVHEGGWTVQTHPGGEFTFTNPNNVAVTDPATRTTRDIVAHIIRSQAPQP